MIFIDMCNFSIPITSSVASIISQAESAIIADGGTFTPTENGGAFTVPIPFGEIDGNFNIISGSANVTITDKPWFVSCGKLENQLTAYLNGTT